MLTMSCKLAEWSSEFYPMATVTPGEFCHWFTPNQHLPGRLQPGRLQPGSGTTGVGGNRGASARRRCLTGTSSWTPTTCAQVVAGAR